MAKNLKIEVRVSEHEKETLQGLAREEGVSMSDYVRRLVFPRLGKRLTQSSGVYGHNKPLAHKHPLPK